MHDDGSRLQTEIDATADRKMDRKWGRADAGRRVSYFFWMGIQISVFRLSGLTPCGFMSRYVSRIGPFWM